MKKFAMIAVAGAGLTCSAAFGQLTGGPVQQGDMALGLSSPETFETLQLVRAGALAGTWESNTWLQSMEFDNLGGFTHNANGNLLGLSFGTSGGGGELYSISTNGTDVGNLIYAFDGSEVVMTRVSGLSVSPDNTKLAILGNDTGSLIVLDYVAGNGDGTGAASLNQEETFYAPTGSSQGTNWLDDDTIITYTLSFAAGSAEISTFKVSTGSISTKHTVTGLAGGSQFMSVAYNPAVSPYVYCGHSAYDSGTFNTLTVLNPSTWAVVAEIDLSTSMNTSRELALGENLGNPALFMGAYGDSAGPIVDVLDISNPAALADNSSIDYYHAVDIYSSYNGLDVAVTGSGTTDCLTLDVANLVAGQQATFTLSGGTPGVAGAVVYDLQTGSWTYDNAGLGWCVDFGLNISGLTEAQNQQVIAGLFNGAGTVSGNVNIPGMTQGWTISFQGAQKDTCPDYCMSNIVTDTVQ